MCGSGFRQSTGPVPIDLTMSSQEANEKPEGSDRSDPSPFRKIGRMKGGLTGQGWPSGELPEED